jgi:HK97 family phage prohead protease
MTAPGFVFDPYSHTWRPAPPSARTRADAEACEVRRERVDVQLRDAVERTARLASRSLGISPPKIRWLPASTPECRGIVWEPNEVWIAIQDRAAAVNTTLHEVRHVYQLQADRWLHLDLLTYEQRQADADSFASSWSYVPEMKSTAGEPLDTRTHRTSLEVKSADDGGSWTISGYASTFGPPADSQGDIIAEGAFTASLATRATKFLFEHQTPIGKQLEIRQDPRGLWGRWSVLPTQAGKDAYLLAKAGVLDSLSIGFIARASRPLGDGTRLLTRIDLFEVSAVALPSNSNAVITDVRTRAPAGRADDDILRALRHKRVQFSRWRGPR